MRVALISHNARAGDAIGNQVAARTRFFRDHGAEVTILIESDNCLHAELEPLAKVGDQSVAERRPAFTVRRNASGAVIRVVSDSADLPRLASELLEYDLLIVEYGQYYRLLELLPMVAGKGPRILFDYHGVTPPQLWDGLAEALREGQKHRAFVWYADQAVVHSQFMRKELCDATGYPSERVHQLPLWFDADRLMLTTGQGKLRRRLNLSDERILLFVGRLAANKRVPVMIEALSLLKDLQPTVHAVMIGDNSDRYCQQLDECREISARHQLFERVHFLGHVSEDDLVDAYQCADLFVMPSLHEGCCIPALEAMTAGLPVIAARTSALPETIAGAGLTFTPDDPSDLASQIRRVLQPSSATQIKRSGRIAVVAPRYGDDVLGGAERSLKLMAESLAATCYEVEVFTTGHGDEVINGVRIHRYAVDSIDEGMLAAATQVLRQNESISVATLNDNLAQTRYSQRLLDKYASRRNEFDACLVGPYGNGLTCEVVRLNPERTLLVPCFHREPLASQPRLASLFSRVGGLLFHSDAERRFAENELGVTHPNSTVIGTWLPDKQGDPERGRRLVGADRPYLLYAGRFCREKNLSLLLDWLKSYAAQHPNQYRFAFIGGGSVTLPKGEEWKNLGFLNESDKADVMAGAAAVVQLSTNESLSLVALEAWQAGVPVIGHVDCHAVREMIEASDGGFAVANYEQFHDALILLAGNAKQRGELGARGREFVVKEFGSRELFTERLKTVLSASDRLLAELMRKKGRVVGRGWDEEKWKRAFAERIEAILHAEPVAFRTAATIAPRKGESTQVRLGARQVNVRLSNVGTAPLWSDGLNASKLCCRIVEAQNEFDKNACTRLPRPLHPGESVLLAVGIPKIADADEFLARFTLVTNNEEIAVGEFAMRVIDQSQLIAKQPDDAALAELAARLAAAESLIELPAGYRDVSEGMLASLKQAVKQKLLHQFQASYVDVLSRQQTALNRVILSAIQELTECAAMLGSPAEPSAGDPPIELMKTVTRLKKQIHRFSRRMDSLEQRLASLEAAAKPQIELHEELPG